ncbi:FGL1 [Branchiostoma lanceolatum]|uniref:FGL1 protein n=1 Tax=Branchiostoma lanceolatum TaxID=7740 RepID=A0A8J9Z2P2_BRALA|nr:FGL1 [Branchiostoma lanceolatum]
MWCVNLGAIANGRVVIDSSATPARARYFCDAGYRLQGTGVRMCESGGRWSDEPPRCTALQCPPVEAPRNGGVRHPRRGHGDVVTYTCDSGYELKGTISRVCQYGEWVGNEPRCEPTEVLCPPVQAPANGAVQVSGRQTGDRAMFTCTPGYEIIGPQSILCQDGVWAGDEPICELKEGDFPRDCTDWYEQGEKDPGVYSIQPRDSDDIFSAWCEFADGGAWTVIQRRQDGSVDFFRNWQDYKNGFGDVAGEYWLGNNNIFHLTNQAKCKLRIDMEDFDGRTFFAEYSHFRVENEANDYKLRLGNHSGNIGDGVTKLDRDQPFTTKDHGARQGSHCAGVQKTGWWFGNVCLNWANLNGIYKESGEYTGEQNGIFWFPLRLIGYPKQHSLKKVTMKLRRLAELRETEPTATPTAVPEECEGQCSGSNCELKSVQNPVDHKTSGFNTGAWMKDPTGDPDTIYYMNNYYVGSILVYRNLDDFKNDRLQKTIKVSACGTGHAIYNNNFYSTRRHSNKMFKMNLKTGATVERVLENAGSTNTYHYQGKALTDIDFAVDEKGLWVIYATPQNGGRIVVSRLNPEDLSIIQTWNTTYTKRNAANAFMICGVLYTVVRQRGVDYSFNTTTGQEGAPDLPFPTVTSDIRHLSYNHRERKLYAWRAGHQVTYDLEIAGLPDKESLPKLCKGKVCKDCSDAFNYHKQDGVYTIEPEAGVSFQVYCRMTDGAGWTVIQRRKDGSESFFRDWEDYKNGFGNPGNELWLGNEKIHALTKRGVYKLRIDLVDYQGNEGFAEYDLFYVAGETDLYKLRLGQYSGTARDSLSNHGNLPFSTRDKDNDGHVTNCAASNKGGWWYDGCYASNLNGRWYPQESHTHGQPDGLVWWQWPHWDNNYHFSLKTTEMRIKFQPEAQDTELYVDCDAVKRSGERGSGVFWIRPRDTVEPFPVRCDLQDGDGAWTVIQQRKHTENVNFTRGWEDYKNGFGVISREYWLGNEKMHQLTKEGDFRVKIQVQSFGGLRGSYEYDNFKVAGEDDRYRLTLSGFTGRVDSCMERAGSDLNGMAFSTIDRDNDRAGYSCAERLKGGWWYNSCSLLMLNGVIKEYNGHDEYREVTGRGEGLYNVCLQQGPPVSLSTVTIKIQARERPDVYRDCDHARSDGKTASGVYHIQPRGATAPFSVFCEMEPSGGGWTVIQRRTKEGTVNFTRGWEDYKRGFGDLKDELWLGLENIYALTNQGQYALQIDFKGYTGVSGYTLYSSFKVNNERDSYRLHLAHRLRGTSDCLNTRSTGKNVTGMAFSTFDRDHDLASYNCAEKFRGGWWFNSCSSVILNGVKKYWKTHDQYYKEVRQGLGLYNVCLQQGPPVSLSDVTMKISTFPNLS